MSSSSTRSLLDDIYKTPGRDAKSRAPREQKTWQNPAEAGRSPGASKTEFASSWILVRF